MDAQLVNRLRRAVGNEWLAHSITSFALAGAAQTLAHKCGEKCEGREDDHEELRARASMVVGALRATPKPRPKARGEGLLEE